MNERSPSRRRPFGSLRILFWFAGLLASSLGPAQRPGIPPIAIPGGTPGIGFDDLRFSPALDRILVPAGRTGTVALVDPTDRRVRLIGGFSAKPTYGGGHDESVTSADVAGGFLYATDRTSGSLEVVDVAAGKIVGGTKLGGSPDYVRYVAPTGEVWVTEPDSERIEIFRLEGTPPKPVHAAFVAVPGGPESLVIDESRGRAYTHLWDGETVSLDLKSHARAAKWANGCKGSRGIALDESRGFLFAGCAEGAATVLDVATGKPLGAVSAGDGIDVIDYNAKLRHLYLPGARSATMATVGVSEQGGLSVLGTSPTAVGSHCVAADASGTAYVCDPKRGLLLVIPDTFPAFQEPRK
jgi:DNA-binding beta-propeller fold protein YncE